MEEPPEPFALGEGSVFGPFVLEVGVKFGRSPSVLPSRCCRRESCSTNLRSRPPMQVIILVVIDVSKEFKFKTYGSGFSCRKTYEIEGPVTKKPKAVGHALYSPDKN